MFSGLFIGTALFGFLADRFGRRPIFTFSLLWYTIATVIMAFQTDVFGLNLWRFISGIGVGIELVTIDSYLSEIVPSELRGRAFAYNNTIQFSAVPIVAFLAWLLVPASPFGLDGWRWVVLIGSAGAIFVWWIRLRVPESPRWLVLHGRFEQAERILAELEKEAKVEVGFTLPAPAKPPGAIFARAFHRNLAAALPLAHSDVGCLQPFPNGWLLRFCELAADPADSTGHHSD